MAMEISRNFTEFKKSRDNKRVEKALHNLYNDAKKGDKFNLIPTMIEAYKSYATSAEIWGTVRYAYGASYDPLNVIEFPYKWGKK